MPGSGAPIDINDNIVQGLTVAKYAIGQGHVEEGTRAIDDTLRRARQLITDQLEEATADQGGPRPGDLVRESKVEELRLRYAQGHGQRPSSEPTPQRLAAIRDQLKLLADYL